MLKRVLFVVCSQNYCRSPTAELIYKSTPGVWARSAGVDSSATVPITTSLLMWADIIICFEDQQKRKILLQVGGLSEVHNVNIPDDYDFQDETLQRLIKRACDSILGVGDDAG